MKITKIYLVTNCYGDPNKVYIGKTINSRKNNHKRTYGSQIIYDYIDEINSLKREDWEPLETYWIETFRQWGFELMNLRKKGGGGLEFMSEEQKQLRRKPRTQETKDKISKANKNKKRTLEMKENYRKGRLNKKHSFETIEKFKNRIRSEESKLKQSITTKGRKINWDLGTKGKTISEEQKNKISKGNSKIVLQFDLNDNFIEEFESYTIAKKYTGIDPQHCLIGKTKSSGGFKWKYK